MTRWLALAPAVPLTGAVLCTGAAGGLRTTRTIALVTHLLGFAVAVAVLLRTADGEVVVTRLGGWPGPIAVPLVADSLAALLLVVATVLAGVCVWFAVASGSDDRPGFHSLVLVLVAGVSGAFLTGDLFTLFVFVEVMLVPSYVLLALGPDRSAGSVGIYLTVNLLASTLLVTGVGLVYAVAGTTNLAALSGAAARSAPVAAAAGVVAFALAAKAALVPLHLWLPRTYPAAAPVVTALFSGLLTKVGVYGLYRLYAVVFAGDQRYRFLALVVVAVTMVVGVLEAIGQDAIRPILASHMVSQVGYLTVGLGLYAAAGLAAAIFYLVQYVLVKTALFLVAAAVEAVHGTGALARLGGLARSSPGLAAVFLAAGLSLAGIPPFSGFIAKFLVVSAAFAEGAWPVGAVMIVVSLGTLLSMLKIWNGVFWGSPPAPEPAGDPEPPRGVPVRLVLPAASLAVLTLALGVGAEGLIMLADRAALGLLDPGPYVEAVLLP